MKLLAVIKRIVPPMWFGIVAAIAAESWLKFQAPGITRELGLGIGKLIFTALNRTEIVLALLLAAAIFAVRTDKIQLLLSSRSRWYLRPKRHGSCRSSSAGSTRERPDRRHPNHLCISLISEWKQ